MSTWKFNICIILTHNVSPNKRRYNYWIETQRHLIEQYRTAINNLFYLQYCIISVH
jgi:hypothetical protein